MSLYGASVSVEQFWGRAVRRASNDSMSRGRFRLLLALTEALLNNRQPKFNEEELVTFAKSYLSAAFPNPQRIGCPPISELACMAELRSDTDPSISEHLSRCSPCFKEYMEILAYVRRRNDARLGASC
jgi:hypothetical protein